MMATPIFSASTRVARKRIEEQFHQNGAFSEDKATQISTSNSVESAYLDSLKRSGAAVATPSNGLFLDESKLDQYKNERTDRLVKILSPALAVVAALIAVGRT